jgi:hypothetical protein
MQMSGFVNSPPALMVDRPALREARTSAVSSAVSGPARLRDACREEIARLARIVRELSCNALLRGTDGSVIPLSTKLLENVHDRQSESRPHYRRKPGAWA